MNIPLSPDIWRGATLGVVPRLAVTVILLGLLLLALALVSMSMGPVSIPLDHVVGIMLGPAGIEVASYTRTEELVVTQLRLPRIAVGALVGLALGTAGATLQGLFRNPMADPAVIGVSAGGAMGAVLAIFFGLHRLFFLALPMFAFLGAMGAAFLVYAIAAVGGRFSMATLLLAGIAVGAFLTAVITTTMVLAPTEQTMRSIAFWLAGGLEARGWEHTQLAGLPILGGVTLVLLMARELNLLMLGDDDARSLGVRVGLTRPLLVMAAALVTGAAVAVSGTIAFVGLIVPHMLRLVVGPDHRVLLPASALGGAVFLVGTDTLARLLVQPAELPVGVLTSFIGAPFFLFLLVRNRRRAGAL